MDASKHELQHDERPQFLQACTCCVEMLVSIDQQQINTGCKRGNQPECVQHVLTPESLLTAVCMQDIISWP